MKKICVTPTGKWCAAIGLGDQSRATADQIMTDHRVGDTFDQTAADHTSVTDDQL